MGANYVVEILVVPIDRTGYCRAKVQIELDLGLVHANRGTIRKGMAGDYGVVMIRSGFIFNLIFIHRVQSLPRKRGRYTGIVVVSRRIAVDSPPFSWKII